MKRILDGIVNAILGLVIVSAGLALTVTLFPSAPVQYPVARVESLPSVGETMEQDLKEMDLERRLNRHRLLRIYDRACGYYAQHARYATLKSKYPEFQEEITDRYFYQKVVQGLEETAEPFIEKMYPRLLSRSMPGCFAEDSTVIQALIEAMDDAGKPYDMSLLDSLYRQAKAREDKFSK